MNYQEYKALPLNFHMATGDLFIPFVNRKKKYTFAALRRNGRAVECGGLENRCSVYTEPGVRIPLPPLNSLAGKSKTPQIIDYVGFFIFPPKQN